MKLLLVEDDREIQEMLGDYLRTEAYEAVSYTHLDVYKRQERGCGAAEAEQPDRADSPRVQVRSRAETRFIRSLLAFLIGPVWDSAVMAGDSPVFYSVRRRKGKKVPWGRKIEAGGRRAACGMRVLPVPAQGGTSLTDPTAATGTGEGRPLIRRGIRRGTFPPKGRLWAGRALWPSCGWDGQDAHRSRSRREQERPGEALAQGYKMEF